MARALQRILTKQGKKVDFRQNKSALLMVFANGNHNAIAQLIKSWVSPPSSVSQHNKQNKSL